MELPHMALPQTLSLPRPRSSREPQPSLEHLLRASPENPVAGAARKPFKDSSDKRCSMFLPALLSPSAGHAVMEKTDASSLAK
jgi:hypothetical protein